jgi:uncharacterized membrane protein YagU involved in acid resistance
MEHKLTSHAGVTHEGAVKNIIIIALIAGTLDAVGAIVIYRADPVKLFQFIASGAFGVEAFSGGTVMACWGLLFHYIISSAWTVIFFFMYPALTILRKNRYLTGLLYGIFVWLVMNQIIMPLSKIPQAPFNFKSALTGISILIVMVGLPISLLTHRYYSKRNSEKTSHNYPS